MGLVACPALDALGGCAHGEGLSHVHPPSAAKRRDDGRQRFTQGAFRKVSRQLGRATAATLAGVSTTNLAATAILTLEHA